MAFLAHRQRASTALTRKSSQHYPYLVPSRAGGQVPALIPAPAVLASGSGYTASEVSTDGTKMFWTNQALTSMGVSDTADLGAQPSTLPASALVTVPAGKGALAGWIIVQALSTGTVLAFAVTDTFYVFMYRTDDDGATWTGPVLWSGSQAADGVSNPQTDRIAPLCAANVIEADVDGIPSILYGEYNFSAPDPDSLARTVWISQDDGVTWAQFWVSSIAAGPLHRKHVHSLLTLSTGDIVVFWGDANSEACIMRGPPNAAAWAGINNLTNAQIEADPNFAILYGSQDYRVIDAAEKNGYMYIAMDGQTVHGIYRLPIDFTSSDQPGGTELVYTGPNDRFLNVLSNHGGVLITAAGTILINEFLTTGDYQNTSELHTSMSTDGVSWNNVCRSLLDTGKCPPDGAIMTDVFQLPTGEIVFGTSSARFKNRGGPPEVPGVSAPPPQETPMVIEQGSFAAGSDPVVVCPRAWVT